MPQTRPKRLCIVELPSGVRSFRFSIADFRLPSGGRFLEYRPSEERAASTVLLYCVNFAFALSKSCERVESAKFFRLFDSAREAGSAAVRRYLCCAQSPGQRIYGCK